MNLIPCYEDLADANAAPQDVFDSESARALARQYGLEPVTGETRAERSLRQSLISAGLAKQLGFVVQPAKTIVCVDDSGIRAFLDQRLAVLMVQPGCLITPAPVLFAWVRWGWQGDADALVRSIAKKYGVGRSEVVLYRGETIMVPHWAWRAWQEVAAPKALEVPTLEALEARGNA